MGGGDVKMLAMIGAFLGWKLVLVTLVFSSIAGAVIGLLVILSRRGDLRYALPYGTFLALAGLIASLYGDRIVAWYVGFYVRRSTVTAWRGASRVDRRLAGRPRPDT